MRVALVTTGFGPFGGGQERWCFQLAQTLLSRGYEPLVIARTLCGKTPMEGIHLHLVNQCGRDPFCFADAAARELLRIRPDIVHDMGNGWGGHLLHYHGGPYGLLSQRKRDSLPPLLRVFKTALLVLLPSYQKKHRFALKQIRRNPGLIVALSRYQAQLLSQLYRVPEGQLRVVYNGIDTVHYSPANRVRYREAVRAYLGVGAKTTVYLLVAHNFHLKGGHVLLQAARKLRSRYQDLHVVIVGCPPRSVFKAGKIWEPLGDWITFTGIVEDTQAFYAAADVYVHPTFYDSCSLSVLEALASGLPVITTRHNGASELMTDGTEGFIIDDPWLISDLCDRMERLLDPRLRDQMGQAARETALLHRFDRCVDEILRLYSEAQQRFQPIAACLFADKGPTYRLSRGV